MFLFETSIRKNLSTLMIEHNSIYHSFLRCFHLLRQRIPRVVLRELSHPKLLLQAAIQSVRMCHAVIGVLARASPRFVQIAASMGSAVSAVRDTERETTSSASLSSRIATERELLGLQENVTMFAEKGPRLLSRPLKRKALEILEPPQFRRGFVWSNNSIDLISPSAIYTEFAPPLPSPPQHLLDDPTIQESIRSLGDAIKVETPFHVDKFGLLLADHPNQPFVASVMRGLREGFWPFDEGDWKIELEEVVPDYKSSPEDAEAIRAFRDREITAGRWSESLDDTELLPGMKISPMFVIWQNKKPRAVTDHSHSGINDGIPQSEAKVKYDDMRTFGQTLHDARAANPGKRLVTFKSDVASAFLNLPAHPIFQLRQVVRIEGKLFIVRQLVFGNRASPRCWCAVSGLLCWLGVRKLGILGLHVYMDDFFGWDYADNLVWF